MLSVCIIFIPLFDAGDASDTLTSGKIPEVSVLGSISDIYEPVEFDHLMHADMAEQCTVCHHQHPGGGALSCKECHSIEPSLFKESVVNNFLPCQSCHDVIDADYPEMPGLKGAYHRTCFTCHRGIANVGLDPQGCTEMCHKKK
jgi:hypothetical protein